MLKNLHFALRMIDGAFAQLDGVLANEPHDYRALNRFGLLTLVTNRRCAEGIAALTKCLSLPAQRGALSHAEVRDILGRFDDIPGEGGAMPADIRATRGYTSTTTSPQS